MKQPRHLLAAMTVVLGLAAMIVFGMVTHSLDAATKIQLNTDSAQTVSNKTFDSTNTYNGAIGSATLNGTQVYSTLTANSIPLLNGSKLLTSTANPTNGQLLIGSTGVSPVLGSLTGTANQITITPGAGTITLSTPQNLHTGASPTFNALTLSTPLTVGNGGIGTSGTPTNGQLPIGNGAGFTLAGLTGTANQITVTPGVGSITLSTPQNLHTGASPTFVGLTVSDAVTSSKTCVTGYARQTPNFCRRAATFTPTWTDATGCTAHTIDTNLPNGTWVVLELKWVGLSNNATGARLNSADWYHDAGCSSLVFAGSNTVEFREQAAVAVGNTLGTAFQTVLVPIVSAGAAYTTQLNAGGNGNADLLTYRIEGYYD